MCLYPYREINRVAPATNGVACCSTNKKGRIVGDPAWVNLFELTVTESSWGLAKVVGTSSRVRPK